MRKNLLLLCCLILGMNRIHSQSISTFSERLNDGWQFVREDLGGVWEAVREATPGQPQYFPVWENISLPHCFNAFDAVDPDVNYYQGQGWYRRKFHPQNPYKDGRTLLHFEGAGQKTDVYIGLDKVASHVGGYDEWFVDITDQINKYKNTGTFDGTVDLSIRCDNSRDLEMIPSDLSDFTIYGGLYRYVNLVYVPQIYVRQVHLLPVVDLKGKVGELTVDGHLSGDMPTSGKLKLMVSNQNDSVAYEQEIKPLSKDFKITFKIKNPKLWSPDRPYLYHFQLELEAEGQSQRYDDNFGFRFFEFEEHGPFTLNGERLLLRGTHRHEDHAGVGAAMTEDMIRKELLMIKDMGANFIRLGHYQQSRIVLNLCDSLGILVWEEIPWCRGGLGGEAYRNQAKRMLSHMIAQHFNHPSIIIWGLGNENDWPGDEPVFEQETIRAFMSGLNDLAHQLDSARKTAIRRCDFCKDIVDVYSPSIWAGWYRGKYTEYKNVSHQEMLAVKHFFHAEWGASSLSGRYSENPDRGIEYVQTGKGADERTGDASFEGGDARVSKDGEWTESYACNLFDWTLKEQESMPWLTGSAFWTFKDFATPIRPENPIPYVNQKGVVTRDLTPKESYYVVQSYWSERPMLHIHGHNWKVRWGNPGERRLVKVYSNCSEVELFLNGTSLGKKKRDVRVFPASGLYWNVSFRSGLNKLRAVAVANGKDLVDEVELNYETRKWGKPAGLEITELPIDEQFSWIEVKMYDENKVICLDANNVVTFSAIGDARLIDDLGTPDGSRTIQLANGVAKIKIMKSGNAYSVAAKSSGLRTALLMRTSTK